MRVAKIEPLTTARALRGPFDYLLGEEHADVGVGAVLEVPFGRRRATGVVVAVKAESEIPEDRLRPPGKVLSLEVPPSLVELGLWTAEEYCSTPARGLGLVLPPGTGAAGRRVRERSLLRAEITDAGRAALAGEQRLGVRQRDALERLAESATGTSVAELATGGISHSTVRALERRGLVAVTSEGVRRAPATTAVGALPGRIELNAAQSAAADALREAIAGERAERAFLLHGVTGSGKTEVYLTAAAAALSRGRGVIALVPEIGLTPQAVTRFSQRFGEQVAILHSRLSDGERHDEWQRLRRGEARICVGPRSAVFAPVRDLGLIVVDEEHDGSYKQEGDPRYDARRVAERRAEAESAVLVCGSATPRPESWHRLPRLELQERVDGQRLPEVEVLDMRGHRGGPVHPATTAALGAVRATGGKAIVLLNRRGWSAWVHCLVCGEAAGCPNCDVSLVLHRSSGALSCHHCGHREPPSERCAACGSASVAQARPGTERLATEIAALLDPLPVFRLDTDAVARPGAVEAVLSEFEQAETGVLVGTQMVAKGHDFPDVVLSVVLDADSTMRFPDFRAEERTFQLVSQLAGRSGRSAAGGKVLVQSLSPDARPIASAAGHDTVSFVESELERRRVLGYPPFGTLIRVQVASPDEQAPHSAAAALAKRLRASLPEGARLLGPAALFRRGGRHRSQLEARSSDREPLIAAVRAAVASAASAREFKSVSVSVDVDPQ